jgi:hypothetical protein
MIKRLLTPSDARAAIGGAGILAAICFGMTGGPACGATQHAERAECSDAALAQIEAAYVAELLERCDGYHLDECPEREAIDAKYDALRKEWVQCR